MTPISTRSAQIPRLRGVRCAVSRRHASAAIATLASRSSQNTAVNQAGLVRNATASYSGFGRIAYLLHAGADDAAILARHLIDGLVKRSDVTVTGAPTKSAGGPSRGKHGQAIRRTDHSCGEAP